LTVTASGGNLIIGNTNQFTANGGNIRLFAKGNVMGGTADAFHAIAVGNPSSLSTSNGGGIEIGSGLTSSTKLNAALALHNVKTGINPASAGALGLNVIYGPSNNLGGVIEANGSNINLNSTLHSPSTLLLNKGAEVFDSQGSTSVKFDNSSFQTDAFKPIAMVSVMEPSEDDLSTLPVVPQGVYARPHSKLVQNAHGQIQLACGEVFINAEKALVMLAGDVEIQADRGAMLAAEVIQGRVYVRACSPAGTISVKVERNSITLNPGEELVVTSHNPDASEISPADGIGRRNTRHMRIGQRYVVINEFAIITMLSKSAAMENIVHSKKASEKKLLERMLKTAATVDTVLKYRGAYAASLR
jgi:hypothetical protein